MNKRKKDTLYGGLYTEYEMTQIKYAIQKYPAYKRSCKHPKRIYKFVACEVATHFRSLSDDHEFDTDRDQKLLQWYKTGHMRPFHGIRLKIETIQTLNQSEIKQKTVDVKSDLDSKQHRNEQEQQRRKAQILQTGIITSNARFTILNNNDGSETESDNEEYRARKKLKPH